MIWRGETFEQWKDRLQHGAQSFALFPTQMDDGRWVWLQRYWVRLIPTHSGRWYFATAIDRRDLKDPWAVDFIGPPRPMPPPPGPRRSPPVISAPSPAQPGIPVPARRVPADE